MEASFLELKAKQVINTVDGKCLGHITDIIFDVVTAKALGFIVPQPNQGFWGLFKGNKDIFIPFDCVCKLGVDVILVELYVDDNCDKRCGNNDSNNKRDKNNKNSKDCGKDKCITLNRGYEEIN
ncbi:MAG: YlmC/YmxH family sporulation protein [Clostridia bacterium]|nr:YlmC/YmxH family sporulation protein [Clostridia bacterium]